MNIQQLEYIVAVEEYQHFGKAAEHCRVTQPTLSMMIQKLEEELDIKLFDRSVQPVRPTSTGTKIIEQARKVLHQVSLIKDISHEEKHNLSGTFRIAVLPTVAPYLLPRFFPQLLKKYPVIDIRMLEMECLFCPSIKIIYVTRYLRDNTGNRLVIFVSIHDKNGNRISFSIG